MPPVSARQFAADERCRFRSTARPGLRLVARLTERCNLHCPHCLASAGGASRDLPLADWQAILAEAPRLSVIKVLLTGGEPLLFEGLVELTAYLTSLGIGTDLNSNLWGMTPGLAAALAHAGLIEASVSLEGPAEVHDAMHGAAGARAAGGRNRHAAGRRRRGGRLAVRDARQSAARGGRNR